PTELRPRISDSDLPEQRDASNQLNYDPANSECKSPSLRPSRSAGQVRYDPRFITDYAKARLIRKRGMIAYQAQYAQFHSSLRSRGARMSTTAGPQLPLSSRSSRY